MGPDNTLDLQYSKDGKLWTQYDFNAIPLNTGETLYMKGNNPNGVSNKLDFETGTGRVYSFGNLFEISGDSNSTTGKYECHGNIMSLLYGDDFEDKITIPNLGCFMSLFSMCDGLLTAPELPATNLTDNCYQSMFYNCSSLISAPALPATTLADECYSQMFYMCKSLVLAPELPATALASKCYQRMFYICDSLVNAPELPATTLADECYYWMFLGCKSLTSAPELPATILYPHCYEHMFEGCKNLNNITMLATDISASGCLSVWVYGVSTTGTFVKHPNMTTLPTGTSGIPEGWTVVDYAA